MSLMLIRGWLESLIDDAESGRDEYVVFKDTMCG